MSDTPRVSVIIPTFNRSAMVCRAVRSVLRQTLRAVEVLVVDDGSTDDTRASVAALADERVRYFYQPNAGRSAARNVGLDAARGDYVAFLDSDDAFLPDKLTAQVDYLDAQADVDLVAGGWYTITDDLVTIQETSPDPETNLGLEAWVLSCHFPPHAALVRRARIPADVRFDGRSEPAEDWGFWLDLARSGVRMRFMARMVAVYVFHGANTLLQYPVASRSALHMLDVFFRRSDLTSDVRMLRDEATARVYLGLALRCLDQDDTALASAHLKAAIAHRPSWLGVDWPELVSWCVGVTSGNLSFAHRSEWIIDALARIVPYAASSIGGYAPQLGGRLVHSVNEQRFWVAYRQRKRRAVLECWATMARVNVGQATRRGVVKAVAQALFDPTFSPRASGRTVRATRAALAAALSLHA